MASSPDARSQGGLLWVLGALATCGLALALDLTTSPEVAGSVPYVVAVLVSLQSGSRRPVLLIAALSSILTAVGFLLPWPGESLWMVIVNRLLGLAAIWAVALLGLQRERLLREAQALAEARNLMLGMASHDLRNPLALLQGSLDLLGNDPEKHTCGHGAQVARMERACRAMRERIETFLDLASLEAGRMTIHPKPVALDAFLAECHDTIAPLIAGHHVTLALKVPEEPPTVTLDPERMAQVIENLVTNACKVSPAGSVVTLGAERIEGAAGLFVRDQGPGIPEEHLETLFAPFTSGETASARRRDSRGLGLTIALRLVEAQGGQLRAESTPGEGTTFHVLMPLGAPAAP